MTTRRVALWALAIAFTVGFGYFAVRDAHPDEVWRALREANAWWLVPALAVLAVGIFIRAVRWQHLFAHETRPPLGAVTSAMLVGLALNNLLPLRAGEAARILALGRRAGVSRVETLGTVALERALDVLCLLVLLFAAVPWLPDFAWLRPAAGLALLLAVGFAVAAVALAVLGERSGRLGHLARGFAGLRRPRIALEGVVWTTLSWVVVAASFWLVTLAFDLGLPPVAGVLVLAATGLAVILPAGPGSLGVFEAAVVIALAAYDVPSSEALSYAFVLHGLNLFPYVAAGAVAARFTRPRR